MGKFLLFIFLAPFLMQFAMIIGTSVFCIYEAKRSREQMSYQNYQNSRREEYYENSYYQAYMPKRRYSQDKGNSERLPQPKKYNDSYEAPVSRIVEAPGTVSESMDDLMKQLTPDDADIVKDQEEIAYAEQCRMIDETNAANYAASITAFDNMCKESA